MLSRKLGYLAMNLFVRFSAVIVVSLLVGSCGYHFQGSSTVLPEDIRNIYIPLVTNETAEPGLSVDFTEILRSRFERYGVVKVVERKEQADAIFEAKINGLTSRVKGVTSQTDIEVEVELTMYVDAELRRKNGQVLWKQSNFMASDDYASTGDTVVTSSADFAQGGIGATSLNNLDSREIARGQSEEAINNLMEEMSRQLYLAAIAADF